MTGPRPDNPQTRVCPECGTPIGALPVRRPWWSRSRSFTLLAIILLALAWIGLKNWQDRNAITGAMPFGPGVWHLTFPDHRFQPADLHAMVAGQYTGASLIESIPDFGQVLDEDELAAAFVPPLGMYRHVRGYGWPLSIIDYSREAHVDDVYEPGHITPTQADAYTMHLALRDVRFTDSGWVEVRTTDLRALATAAALVIIAWWLGAAARVLLRTASRHGSARHRFSRFLPALCAALAVLAIATLTLATRDRDNTTWRSLPLPRPTANPTGLSATDIQRLRSAGDDRAATQSLARAILEATSTATPAPDDVLILGWHTAVAARYQFTLVGWPQGLLLSSSTHYPEGTPSPAVRQRPLRFEYGFLTLQRWHAAADGSFTASYTSIGIGELSLIIVMLIPVWFVGIIAGFIVHRSINRTQNRKIRNRLRNGHCLHCGYDLNALPPAATTVVQS